MPKEERAVSRACYTRCSVWREVRGDERLRKGSLIFLGLSIPPCLEGRELGCIIVATVL